MKSIELHHGNALDVLRKMSDNTIDSIAMDPPAGIAFMGKAWDGDKGGRKQWTAWLAEIMSECLRVLKPGGHAVVWALPRTSHWTATAIEDAGFEIRFILNHLFGQGFPKSHDVGKAIDCAAGVVRTEVVSTKLGRPGMSKDGGNQRSGFDAAFGGQASGPLSTDITAPATKQAKQWDGHGTALKPSSENWILTQKPLEAISPQEMRSILNQDHWWIRKALDTPKKRKLAAKRWSVKIPNDDRVVMWTGRPLDPEIKGRVVFRVDGEIVAECDGPKYSNAGICNVAANVLKWGTGAINIDGCRISTSDNLNGGAYSGTGAPASTHTVSLPSAAKGDFHNPEGRWPPDTLFTHAAHCRKVGKRKVKTGVAKKSKSGGLNFGSKAKKPKAKDQTYADATGKEEIDAWECVEGCPIKELDRQSGDTVSSSSNSEKSDSVGYGSSSWVKRGVSHADAGGASRFFPTFKYEAKPAGKEKNTAAEKNKHPTVKGVELMRWLVRLVTPPNGTVLDCFMGSGSTGIACQREGFNFIGVELERESFEFAHKRLAYSYAKNPILRRSFRATIRKHLTSD